MRRLPALALLCLAAGGAQAQSALGHSPNLRPAWSAVAGQTVLRIGHRFEVSDGGDQLLNVPTLTVGTGLGRGLALGLDYTSNSEIVPDRLGRSEVQPWLAWRAAIGSRLSAGLVAAWNSAAHSADAALSLAGRAGALTLLGELRGFSDALGSGTSGASGTVGAAVRLTPHLEVSGDAGQIFSHDTLATVWSAGVAMAIPGTPHTLSLHATNGGATTLQGAAHPKILGGESVRYGFVFTIPLGSRRQWGQIFSRGAAPDAAALATAAAVVEIRMIALSPGVVRIRAGESVAWVNHDPLPHTVTADDGTWGSEEFTQGGIFVQRFDRPGRYSYHCIPHPQMTGVVIVL